MTLSISHFVEEASRIRGPIDEEQHEAERQALRWA